MNPFFAAINIWTHNRISYELTTISSTIHKVLNEGRALKFALVFIMYIQDKIVIANKEMFLIIGIMYVIDFATGIIRSAIASSITSARFFRGVLKIAVYVVLMIIGYSIDFGFGTDPLFMTLFFISIIVNDSISILENLGDLGYNSFPALQKFLKSYGQNMRRKKLTQFDPSAANFEDYCADITEMEKLYLPKVRSEGLRRLLMIRLQRRGSFCSTVQNLQFMDNDIFRSKVLLLAKETIKDIDVELQKASIDQKYITYINDTNRTKQERFLFSIENISAPETQVIEFEILRNGILKEMSLMNYQALNECLSYIEENETIVVSNDLPSNTL